MDVVKRRIVLMIGIFSLLCLIAPGFAQTPAANSVQIQKRGNNEKRPAVLSNAPFARGHVFAAVSNGQVQHYDETGNLLGVLDTGMGGFTTGMATDSTGNLYVTNFSLASVSKFTGPGVPHNHSVAFMTDPSSSVESILFDKNGDIYVGQADGTRDILKFDAAGNFLMRFDVATESRGSDWIDLDADQQTMYYTTESKSVKRFDVVNNIQLSDFAVNLPGSIAYALRLLPGGGMLVADTEVIVRLDAAGNVIQTYDVAAENTWFALNLAPDGTSFWSGNFDTGNFYKFDIASGSVLIGPINTNTGSFTLFGLAVFGEIAVGQNNAPISNVTPSGPFLINQGETLTFNVSATDPDAGDTITLDVIGLPPGATMTPSLPLSGPNTGISSTFMWTPTLLRAERAVNFEVVYVAEDQGGLTDTFQVQITVNSTPNITVTPAGPFVVDVGDPLTFNVLATDQDLNDLVTLNVADLPAGATMTPSLPLTGLGTGVSSTFNWTPAAGQEDSTYVIKYTAVDTNMASTSASVSITVQMNNPPVCEIIPPGPFVINENDPLTFAVSASDPDMNDVITLDVLGALPVGANMTPSLPFSGPASGISAVFDWTPALGQGGIFTVAYIVTDAAGASHTCSTEITVNPLPLPPVCQVTPPGPFVLNPGDLLTFSVSALDPNPGDQITLDVIDLPTGATMTPTLPLTGPGTGISSTFNWTPTPFQFGTYVVTYVVVDNSGLTSTCLVNITVNAEQNLPPVCEVIPPGPFTIIAGNLLTFNVSATDPNVTDVITLDVSGLPSGATMTPGLPLTGSASGISSVFNWTPLNSQFGLHVITYTVADTGGLGDTCTVMVTVDTMVVNYPPVCQIAPPGPFTINVGDFLTFDVSATDPNAADVIVLDVIGLPAGATMTPVLPLSGPGTGISSTFEWTPAPGQTGPFVVTYTVTDPFGLQSTCVAQIMVNQPNIPPVCDITPGTSFNIFVGQFLTFDVTATDANPGDILTLDMFPGDVLPAGATMAPPLPISGPSPLSSTFGWTPVAGQEGIYLFGYLITDNLGAQTFCKVDITVSPDSIAPMCELTNIDPGPPFTIEVTVQDGQSGIVAVNIITSNNANVNVPSFPSGTNDPIIITAVKIDQGHSATVVLEVVDGAGNTTLCDPVYQTISAVIPEGFALQQNFPNPFNPTTAIHFDVAAGNGGAQNVSLKIYDITGREVKTLIQESMQPGKYSVEWDATNNRGETVAGGVYIYRMVVGDFVATKKMVLLK